MLRAKRQAFTLVEMLVVLAVVVLLVSMLMPWLSIAMREAKRTACLSSIRQRTMGWVALQVAHGEMLQPYAYSFLMHQQIQTYLSDSGRHVACAETAVPASGTYDIDGNPIGSATSAIVWDRSARIAPVVTSYAFNAFLYNKHAYFGGGGPGGAYYAPNVGVRDLDLWFGTSTAHIPNMSRVPVLVDSSRVDVWATDDLVYSHDASGVWLPKDWQNSMVRLQINRHIQHTTNIGYADGHAAMVGLNDLWQQDWSLGFEHRQAAIPWVSGGGGGGGSGGSGGGGGGGG